jgi:hypothetical protein
VGAHLYRVLARLRDRACRAICGDRLFNADMSLELDALVIEKEKLRDEIEHLLDQVKQLKEESKP